MDTINFYCRRCGAEIFPNNAQEEYGDTFIGCGGCGAKNVVAPFIFNKTVVRGLWQIIGWRD